MSEPLDRRLRALAEAVGLAEGRLDGEAVHRARAVVGRAGERLGLGVDSTVVALAGPTGAGKSSLFNALAGSDVSPVARRRPTTSQATALTWGGPAGDVLDWLGVLRRHRAGDDGALHGLVLLDLPDFDSVESAHRLEVDRLIQLVDLLVWVVDPQKYADALLHERYLRPLAAHADVTVVALNQADLLAPDELERCLADVRRLLAEDGLDGVPVLATSARTGAGLAELRELVVGVVRRRHAATARLGADVTSVARELVASAGERDGGGIRAEDRRRLLAALEEAAGVPGVVRAVGAGHRRRGALATGWPFVRWLRRLRPDPLRRLRLPDRPAPETHTSLAPPTPVQLAQVSAALRSLAAGAAGDVAEPWPGLVRRAATAREDELAERLDRAVAAADLHMSRPRWWRVAGWLQRVLFVVVVAGLAWLAALVALGFFRVDEVVPLPEVYTVPVPTLLAVGGAAAGLVLSVLAGVVNRAGASRRRRAAARSLRRRLEDLGEELAFRPVEAELAAHDRLAALLREAESEAPTRQRRFERRRPGAIVAARRGVEQSGSSPGS